jgi:flagellar biosynthetic protein FliS
MLAHSYESSLEIMDTTIAQRLRKDYLESRILSAHPVEIVAMLYEVAIDSLNEAIGHLKTCDRFARSRAVTRAEQAIQELLIALDHSVNAPFSRTSEDLYRYTLSRIVAGHAQESEAAFQEALTILKPLASAWADLKARLCEEPKAAAEAPTEQPSNAGTESVNDPYEAYRQNPAAAASRDWSC